MARIGFWGERSSNSTIISSEDQIAITDPGGLDDLTDRLMEVLFDLYDRSNDRVSTSERPSNIGNF